MKNGLGTYFMKKGALSNLSKYFHLRFLYKDNEIKYTSIATYK